MFRQLTPLAIVIALIMDTGCQTPPPKVYLAERSPDQQKLGYVKQYYDNLLLPSSSVYPQYSLAVKEKGRDRELLKLHAKELTIWFAAIAWTDDSKVVGFFLECTNRTVKRAYYASSGKEVPFQRVEATMRRQVNQQWQAHIRPDVDPLDPESQPRVGLRDAFQSWRNQQFK